MACAKNMVRSVYRTVQKKLLISGLSVTSPQAGIHVVREVPPESINDGPVDPGL